VGNALETIEAFEVLHGRGPDDLTEVTLALGASMLVMGGVAADEDAGGAQLREAVRSGRAAAVARRMVAAQGGDARAVDDPTVFPRAPVVVPVTLAGEGFVTAIDTHAVGVAGVVLGAGRTRAEDTIDPAVGFVFARSVGDRVAAGEAVAHVHARDEASARDAVARLQRAFSLGDIAPAAVPLLHERIG